MAISFLTNVDALKAEQQLGTHSRNLAQNLERLSSGLRINRASDDAAGLSVASLLHVELHELTVASRNANDGISLVSIMDASLGVIGNILTRMAELAEQSINGTLQNVFRSPLHSEFVALSSEISRIASATVFNGINLLVSATSVPFQWAIQVGIDKTSHSQVIIQGASATLESLHLGSYSNQLVFSLIDTTVPGSIAASESALAATILGIQEVAKLRGQVGASASRLNHAVNNIEDRKLNTSVAESNIRSVDIAEEAAKYTRNVMLQNAAAAVLAQANIQPDRALALLA